MPEKKKNIDAILHQWPYDPDALNVRTAKGDDGRDVIQMRIDMGVLQLETTGRPDGDKPLGFDTYYDYLLAERLRDDDMVLDDEQCHAIDREFVQFYHRRICWLSLKMFTRAVADADHTLALMDFCQEHSPDEQWTMSHEQYRPFVLFHRIQAAALAELEEDRPEAAVHQINLGLDSLHDLYTEHDAEDVFEDDELVARLTDLRESLRDHYNVGRTLDEQLQDAVAKEQYELAARIRDELARRKADSRR
jgi:hypothetical protein